MNVIGIDFGTTKTIAAIYRNNCLEIIPDSKGRTVMPSLVLISPENEIAIGWEAKLHPQRYFSEYITINSIKRIIGKKQFNRWGSWETKPQEIASLILARLKIEVEKYLGNDSNDVIIAIPAHFDINQRWAVIQAAEIAGFKVRRLINEATAAAALYTNNISKQGTAMVVDIGGGTTDVSIIRYGDGVIEVVSTAGYFDLGGDDFDKVIIDYIKKIVNEKTGEQNKFTLAQEFILWNVADAAKTDLSESLETHIYLPGFIRREGKKYDDLDIILTREIFNKLIESFLKRILILIDDARKNVGIEFKDIDTLILVGGTSRVPIIREVISNHTGIQPKNNINPIECVAGGAAVCAGVLNGNKKDMLLLDTFPSSLSVEGPEGITQVIIPGDTTIPTRDSKIFTTVRDNQENIEINFYEGESENEKDNTFIGNLLLTGIPPAKKGVPKIEVTIDIDANGVIHASAKDKITNKSNSVKLNAPFHLTQEQLNILKNSVWAIMKKYSNKYMTNNN